MSYQVFARKWRPKKFMELVGQEHVVRALSHALDHDRVHHAFLFTGTRGVGKTTIARIFAKSLNCDQGMSSQPCGICATCADIDSGRFIDLLEIDAASRTRVDDTREMLDNVVYAPTRGRYKVYLIDEVHMLSGHSFNALLKTLEEPPPHVKFLLATTDPQKLPITVLSRCLQFHLKRLSESQIQMQLNKILAAENISYDIESVQEIARSGNGSMRDALSLLDQAIAFGGGQLVVTDVHAMLGTIDRTHVIDLLTAVLNQDAQTLYEKIAIIAEFSPDFTQVLSECLWCLHRLQLLQVLKDIPIINEVEHAWLQEMAQRVSMEQVQMWYQIALMGRRDITLAPDPRMGFEMTVLRMLTFQPLEDKNLGQVQLPVQKDATQPHNINPADLNVQAPEVSSKDVAYVKQQSVAAESSHPLKQERLTSVKKEKVAQMQKSASTHEYKGNVPPTTFATSSQQIELSIENWQTIFATANLRGPTMELLRHSALLSVTPEQVRFGLARNYEYLRNDKAIQQINQWLQTQTKIVRPVYFEMMETVKNTLIEHENNVAQTRQAQAELAIAEDLFVQQVIADFDAVVIPDSVKPRSIQEKSKES